MMDDIVDSEVNWVLNLAGCGLLQLNAEFGCCLEFSRSSTSTIFLKTLWFSDNGSHTPYSASGKVSLAKGPIYASRTKDRQEITSDLVIEQCMLQPIVRPNFTSNPCRGRREPWQRF